MNDYELKSVDRHVLSFRNKKYKIFKGEFYLLSPLRK
jgi:hypothetical protein